ncbi:MAG: T9SS type A sorting domain-containing protein [bacterium]
MKKNTLVIAIFIFMSSLLYGQGITFSLANGQVTNSGGKDYYEFDIMAIATENTKFYIAQVYIDYSTLGFGSSIHTNGKVTVTTSGITTGTMVGAWPNMGAGTYVLTTADNTASKLAVQNTFSYNVFGTYTGKGYELTNTLGTVAQVYAHVKIEISNTSQSSGLAFDATVVDFDQQQYYYTTPGSDATAKYNPVNVGSGLNQLLPVELTSFSANNSGRNVVLNWSTATEVNNHGFEVERVVNLQGLTDINNSSNLGGFESIGFVEGYGNSNSTKDYSFTDKSINGGGKFSYRLKQIDTDGSYSYSGTVEVTVIPNQFELSQNYPNPFNPTTTIKYSIPAGVETPYMASLRVYDILGNEVATLVNEQEEPGYYEVEWNASQFASGVYIFRLMAGNFIDTKKMILLR